MQRLRRPAGGIALAAWVSVAGACALAGCGSHAQRPTGPVVGNGTAASCTSAAVVAAVRHGGDITFSCGHDPVTIEMTQTAKVVNTSPAVTLDGAGKVTLDGDAARRILYMDTCDRAQIWTTSHCDQQPTPKLTIEGITFEHGNSIGDGATGGGAVYAFGGGLLIEHSTFVDNECAPATGGGVGGGAVAALWQDRTQPARIVDSTFTGNVCDNPGAGGGGGAVFDSQGSLVVQGSTFTDNRCVSTGPDVGGGAVRVFFNPSIPAQVSHSTFRDNVCSNGAALSSVDSSWTVADSTFADNHAIGYGANPARAGTPGGGSGGAIYNDGETMHLSIDGSTLTGNTATEGGGSVFFVSDDRTGTVSISHSRLVGNPNAGFQTPGLEGIFFLGASAPAITSSVISAGDTP